MKRRIIKNIRPAWQKVLFASVALLLVASLVTVLTRNRTKPVPSDAAVATYADKFGIAGFANGPGYNAGTLAQYPASLKQGGIKSMRAPLSWQVEQPNGPNDAMGSFKQFAVNAKNNGVKIVANIGYTPPWARTTLCKESTSNGIFCEPRSAQEYADWAGKMAAFYSQPENGGIHHWELWNEPNHTGFWKSGRSAAQNINPVLYANMVMKAYDAIRDADSTATVYIGATSPAGEYTPEPDAASIEPRSFLMQLYDEARSQGKDLGDHYTHFSHHAYTWSAYRGGAIPNFHNVLGWYMMYRDVTVGTNEQVNGSFTCPTPAAGATLAQRAALLNNLASNARPSLRCIMKVYGASSKKIMQSEAGSLHGKFIYNNPPNTEVNYTETVQKQLIEQAFNLWVTYPWAESYYNFRWADGVPFSTTAMNVNDPDAQVRQGIIHIKNDLNKADNDPANAFGCNGLTPTGRAKLAYCWIKSKMDDPLPTSGSAPTVSLSASDTTITSGSDVTLNWTVTGADSCTATNGALGWAGSKDKDGGSQTLAQAVTKTYNIECTNGNGSASDAVTVNVGTIPALSLAASPSTITAGQSSTLSWTVSDANSCTASGGWTGSKAAGDGNHTQVVTPTSITTYNLVCTNAYGSSTPIDSATVTVSTVTPPSITFTVNKTTMKAGESATLTWSTTNATSCTAGGSWTGSKAISGTQTVNPINDVLYNLTCTGPGGSNSANAGIDVTSSGILGDIADPPNGNGVVNANDLSFLITRWGTNNARADLDNDGVVSFTDFSLWVTYNVQANP
jgi:hypothetical protein